MGKMKEVHQLRQVAIELNEGLKAIAGNEVRATILNVASEDICTKCGNVYVTRCHCQE